MHDETVAGVWQLIPAEKRQALRRTFVRRFVTWGAIAFVWSVDWEVMQAFSASERATIAAMLNLICVVFASYAIWTLHRYQSSPFWPLVFPNWSRQGKK